MIKQNMVYEMLVYTVNSERSRCIKGLFWPPPEPKSESCFSPISSDWFIKRITKA